MAPRVSPTETIRAQIDDLFSSDRDLLSVLEQAARLSDATTPPRATAMAGNRLAR